MSLSPGYGHVRASARGRRGLPVRRAAAVGLALMLPAAPWALPSLAAGTAAGTDIVNTATAAWLDPGSTPHATGSNTVVVTVAEILDVTIVPNDPGPVPVLTPDVDRVLSFTVTNTGNGPEAFDLSAATALLADQFDPAFDRIVLDSNGNGIFDAALDTIHVSGTNDPLLAPDASIVVFLLSDIPGSLADGDLGRASLAAAALTGSGPPGTLFPGQGSAGVDALVGATTAAASAEGAYLVSQIVSSLVKSQAVTDPGGGSLPLPGAVITYTLTFTLAGLGSITGGLVSDAIPAGTTYLPGSLSWNGAGLTDTLDADAGRFTGSAVEVALGSPAAPSTHVIAFRVVIN